MKKIDQLAVPDLLKKTARLSEKKDSKAGPQSKSSRDHVDAINQMFAEFELAYHNQYHKAFPDEGALNLAKKYWLNTLAVFSPELILKATRQLVLSQPYLPTIANVADTCKNGLSLFGLPSIHDAYLEACRKASPKSAQQWSHLAVYLAGRATGWFELANQTEAQIFPLFDYHYSQLMQRVLHGEELKVSVATPLPETSTVCLSANENLSRLKELKTHLKIQEG
tara:strand:+ start:3857 stop:4528 length:672 start_codon:yes stop_codon:yes gene_type:complete